MQQMASGSGIRMLGLCNQDFEIQNELANIKYISIMGPFLTQESKKRILKLENKISLLVEFPNLPSCACFNNLPKIYHENREVLVLVAVRV